MNLKMEVSEPQLKISYNNEDISSNTGLNGKNIDTRKKFCTLRE